MSRNLFHRASSLQRKSFTKLSHKLWATNKIQHQRSNRRIDHRCSRCGQVNKNWDHTFKFSNIENDIFTQVQLHTLRDHMTQSQMAPIMVTFIIQGIMNWLEDSNISPFIDPPPNDTFYHHLLCAYELQTLIGWDQFLCGRLSLEWAIAHDIYVKDRDLSTTRLSQHTIPHLILAIFDFGNKIWQKRNTISSAS